MTNKQATTVEGIQCYAPDKMSQNDGFHSEDFELLYRLEEKSFWFRVRNKIIRHFVKQYVHNEKGSNFLEIGCGNAYVLKGLMDLPGLELKGSEIYLEGLKHAKERMPQIEFMQLDATEMPFKNTFDGIGAFDVLEHIEEDEKVMEQVKNSLKPGGVFVITVPQYPWMWTYLDDHACHKRRYTRRELKQKLEKNGLEIVFLGSFVTLLFPMQMVSRFLKKGKKLETTGGELDLPSPINAICFGLMYLDYLLIRIGLRLPFGGSLICIAAKEVGG